MKLRRLYQVVKIRYFVWVLTFLALAFIVAGVLHYWLSGLLVEKSLVERVQDQELILAHSGEMAVSYFFQDKKTELLLLAEMAPVKRQDEEGGRKTLRSFIDQVFEEEGFLTDAVRTDKKGIVLWAVNVEANREGEGISLADREYFQWASEQKQPGEALISQPIRGRGGLKKGSWALVMVTPVFNQNSFDGVLFLTFYIDELVERLINPLLLWPETTAQLVSGDGQVMASNQVDLVGKDIQDCLDVIESQTGRSVFSTPSSIIDGGSEGSLVHSCPADGPKTISAYASARIGSQDFLLLVSTPYEKILNLSSPLRGTQVRWLIFDLIGLLLLILVFIIGFRMAQRKAFINGFRNGRDGVIKKLKKG
jgi:hypothetical protein